ncbi:PPE family protein [Mycobacterium tuberculosis]|nr:PPE family protein [Mycobacterium tuberculosis]
MAAATITPFPFGELAKFLEMAAQAFTEVGELIMKSAEAWAVGFVELITAIPVLAGPLLGALAAAVVLF